jgi:hypothetical protein
MKWLKDVSPTTKMKAQACSPLAKNDVRAVFPLSISIFPISGQAFWVSSPFFGCEIFVADFSNSQ